MAALTQGVLRVAELEAVLPDGLVVSRELDDAEPLELDLAASGAELAGGRAAMVHLAVPVRRSGVSPLQGEFPRYRSIDGGPVVDESSGEGDVDIPRLRPCPVLLLGEAPPLRYSAIPIARVRRADEKFRLDDAWEPPSLRVPLGSRLPMNAGSGAKVLTAR